MWLRSCFRGDENRGEKGVAKVFISVAAHSTSGKSGKWILGKEVIFGCILTFQVQHMQNAKSARQICLSGGEAPPI